jgi:hypothetical protein
VKGFGSPKAKARAAAAAATTTTMASLSLPLPLPLPAPPAAAAARLKAARDLSPERTSLHLPLLHATSVGSSSSSSGGGGGGGSNGNALSMSGFSSSPVRGNRGRFMTTGSATIDV